jgi:flagellar hook-length control protein FliK
MEEDRRADYANKASSSRHAAHEADNDVTGSLPDPSAPTGEAKAVVPEKGAAVAVGAPTATLSGTQPDAATPADGKGEAIASAASGQDAAVATSSQGAASAQNSNLAPTLPPATAETAPEEVAAAAAAAKPLAGVPALRFGHVVAEEVQPKAGSGGDATDSPDANADPRAAPSTTTGAAPGTPAQAAPPAPAATAPDTPPKDAAVTVPAPHASAPNAVDAVTAALAPLTSLSGPAGAAQIARASDPQAGPAVPLDGLAVEIASRAADGKRRFEVRLDPAELGRIDVRLDIARDGQVTSRLIVERAETLDLLRRDSQSLQQALQSAGLRTDGSGLQFSLRDQSGGYTPPADANSASKLLIVPDADVAVHEAVRRGYGVLRGLHSGIDIRV